MVTSNKFQFKKEDVVRVAHNALVFLGPVLLVAIPALAQQIPAEAGYGAVALYVLNVLADALRKYLSVNKYK